MPAAAAATMGASAAIMAVTTPFAHVPVPILMATTIIITTGIMIIAITTTTAAGLQALWLPARWPAQCIIPFPAGVTVLRNGVQYYHCGDVWYRPRYQGSNITYIVVNAP
jgi:hypothetical protein